MFFSLSFLGAMLKLSNFLEILPKPRPRPDAYGFTPVISVYSPTLPYADADPAPPLFNKTEPIPRPLMYFLVPIAMLL